MAAHAVPNTKNSARMSPPSSMAAFSVNGGTLRSQTTTKTSRLHNNSVSLDTLAALSGILYLIRRAEAEHSHSKRDVKVMVNYR